MQVQWESREKNRFQAMTVKKFVVSAAQEPSKSIAAGSLVIAGGPLIAAISLMARGSSLSQQIIVAALCLVTLLVLNWVQHGAVDNESQVTVTVYPMGVQLAKLQKLVPVRPPLLIPRDLILDVIVNEVILAHKVVSIVLFRVLKEDANDLIKPPVSTLLKEGRIKLVPAFPGVEMSFAECQAMRRELSACLGLGPLMLRGHSNE